MSDISTNKVQEVSYVPIVTTVVVNWFEIDEVGLPCRDQTVYYGDRYSVPVIIAKAITGQRENHTVVYDYRDGGWCLYGLPNGPSCKNYSLLAPTHYCFMPVFAIE